jgi:hypothetical protein
MAARFEGVSAPATGAWEAPYPLSPGGEYVVGRADHRLPLVRSPLWAPLGVHKCRAARAAALAGRGDPGRDASPPPRHGRGTRDDSGAGRGRRWGICPLAQAALRAWRVAARAKGSSSLVLRTRQASPWRTVILTT